MENNPRFDPKLLAAFRQRMARNALDHQEQYAVRTGTILAAKGILEGVHHENADPALPAIIADADHPDRVPTPDGPLLFCRSPAGSASITCVEMPELVLHPEQAVRAGAVRFFQRLGPGLLCRRSTGMLEECAADVESPGEDFRRTASVELFDALDDDHFLALAGIRQSLAMGYNEMVAKFVARALHPSLLAMDALGSDINNASIRQAEVAERLKEIARYSRSVPEVCAAYLEEFGHVPLAAAFSLGHAVSLWQREHRIDPPDASWWPQVWSWAETSASPLARYHVLSLFTQRPDLVSADLQPTMRTGLLAFLASWPEVSSEQPAWSVALTLRDEVARHYFDYLNCRVAPLIEDIIGEWAWWMAERFCACFGTDARLLRRVLDGAVRPARITSAYESALTPARPRRSNLCYATEYADGLWPLALLTGIDGKFLATMGATFSEADAQEFVRCLYRHLGVALPNASGDAAPPVYAVDEPLVEAVRKWALADPGTALAEVWQNLADEVARRFEPGAVVRQFEDLSALSQNELLSAVLTLRALFAVARAPTTELLTCLSDPARLDDLVSRLDPERRDELLSTLVAAASQDREAWLGWLHRLAAVCEQPDLDAARRTAVFEYLVIACAVSDAVGPVSKLLNGPCRDLFMEDASICGAKLEAAYPACAQSIKAAIRSITSVLQLS